MVTIKDFDIIEAQHETAEYLEAFEAFLNENGADYDHISDAKRDFEADYLG